MAPTCERCGHDLEIQPIDDFEMDWVKVVCSHCGNVESVSMVRISQLHRTHR